MRKVSLAVLASALAIGAGSACSRDLTNPGIETPGDFFVEIRGHKDTTITGEALFYQTVQDGSELLSILLVTPGARFQLSFAVRDFSGEPEEHDISLAPERYEGSYFYGATDSRVTYEITGGTLSLTDVESRRLEGEFIFESVATSDPNTGNPGRITGWFRAVCDGECVRSGPPPGGS